MVMLPFTLHPLHPRTQGADFTSPVLSPGLSLIRPTDIAPSCERDDDTTAIILGAQILGKVDNGRRGSMRIVSVSRQVDDLLVGD